MAAPNMISITTITGKTAAAAVTTSSSNLVSNSAASGQVFKINTLVVTNISVSSATVTVEFKKPSTTYKIASTIAVPASSTLVVISKDISVYLEEGDTIGILASANSALEAVCSYEVIS